MPEEGIDYVDRNSLLNYEEIERLCSILSAQGVEKLRITGGEPFIRKDLPLLLQILRPKFKSLHITTNGTRLHKYGRFLEELHIDSVNLSLDTIQAEKFHKITRRDVFKKVWTSIEQLIKTTSIVNINVVVIKGVNDEEILDFCNLTKDRAINVRFIESMPFNGSEQNEGEALMTYLDVLEVIRSAYPIIQQIKQHLPSSSVQYYVPGHEGKIAVIPAYSRTLCGTCNRLRISPTGVLKTCLYDSGVFNLRDMMRAGASDEQLTLAIQDAVLHKPEDGFQAEKQSRDSSFFESMATIGG
jgi:cyclic pyranopterin phosphate synthase